MDQQKLDLNSFDICEYYECEKQDIKAALIQAIRSKNKLDGEFTRQQLIGKGWVSKSYVKKGIKTTDYYVECGYGGCYNKSHLVKVLIEDS